MTLLADTIPPESLHSPSGAAPLASWNLCDYRTGGTEDTATLLTSVRNIRLMHLLERLAGAFNEAGIPLMILKGAALNLALYETPEQRPMDDLDLLVRPGDVQRACDLLLTNGCLYGEPLVREDFFPRFHYEREFRAGSIRPTKIDLHARPFRPLRYARLVPQEAFWDGAVEHRIGSARVLLPSPPDMLIHLGVHSAVHGNIRQTWLQDVRGWIQRFGPKLDWDQIVEKSMRWRLVLPLCQALKCTETAFPGVVPAEITAALSRAHVNWRDRLSLWHARRDAKHPATHLLVNALCTPGLGFTVRYLAAALLPDRVHMGDWYARRHVGWLPCAHLLRIASPLRKLIPGLATPLACVEVRPSALHGMGVFATRDIEAGQTIAFYEPKPVNRDGMYVAYRHQEGERVVCYELTGRLRFLNHSCRPNARLEGLKLLALRAVLPGQEVTIDYGDEACSCGKAKPGGSCNADSQAA